jgi:hypothetical protein
MTCKKFRQNKYGSLKDAEREIDRVGAYAPWPELASLIPKGEAMFWRKMTAKILYDEDTYQTNKYCHLLNMLEDAGFEFSSTCRQKTDSSLLTKISKAQKAELEANFSPSHPLVAELNKYLVLPDEQVEHYRSMFLEKVRFQQHFNITNWLFRGSEQMVMSLQFQQEVDYFKMKSVKSKLICLEKFMKQVGCCDKLDVAAKRGLSAAGAAAWKTKMMDIFSISTNKKGAKSFDLTTASDCSAAIRKMYGTAFGTAAHESGTKVGIFNVVETKTKVSESADKKRQYVRTHTVNPAFFEYHTTLAQFRSEFVPKGRVSYEFGAEVANCQPECLIEDDEDDEPDKQPAACSAVHNTQITSFYKT